MKKISLKIKVLIILLFIILTLSLILILNTSRAELSKAKISEISKINKILEKPEGIQAYTVDGEKTELSYDYLLNNNVVNKVYCKNGTKISFDKYENSIELSDIQMPDYCTIDFLPTIYTKLLADHPIRSKREDFTKPIDEKVFGTLFTATETISSKLDGTVYYFAGNDTDNWIYFAGYYWRIIRTNADGSIRLLYVGDDMYTSYGFIGVSAFNSPEDAYNPMHVGYMYGNSNNTELDMSNTNSSLIKQYIDNWYKGITTIVNGSFQKEYYSTNFKEDPLINYQDYLSTTAVYCNDREIGNGTYGLNEIFDFTADDRIKYGEPTYDCKNNNSDKFAVSNKKSNLKYPIGLMTADEAMYAGAINESEKGVSWISLNAENDFISTYRWWLMTPNRYETYPYLYHILNNENYPSNIVDAPAYEQYAVRPVISIKGDLLWISGDGSQTKPYKVELYKPTIYEKILADNPTVVDKSNMYSIADESERYNSLIYTGINKGKIFSNTESIIGNTPKKVYFFAGNPLNNWVKFGTYDTDVVSYEIASTNEYHLAESCPTDSNVTNCEKIASKGDAIYWKIIRTNYDRSIRLLYTFNVTTLDQTTPIYNSKMIGSAPYNVLKTANDKIHLLTYVGYMYKVGDVLDLDSNENDSTIKLYLEEWYKKYLDNNYSKFISNNAVYCNDRQVTDSGDTGIARERLFELLPSYNCDRLNDAFTTTKSIYGNNTLNYPVGLLTSDEVLLAGTEDEHTGGLAKTFIINGAHNSGEFLELTDAKKFYTMTPGAIGSIADPYSPAVGVLTVGGVLTADGSKTDSLFNFEDGRLSDYTFDSYYVRPVISIKGDNVWKSGDGSILNPYEIEM